MDSDDTSPNNLYDYKVIAEEKLASAIEMLPDSDIEDLIIEVSGDTVTGDRKEILKLAESHNELFLTSVEIPLPANKLNAFDIIRVRMQEELMEHLRKWYQSYQNERENKND